MANRAEQIEELLWDLEDFYPDSEVLEEAWEIFNADDDLPNNLLKKLRRMLARATKGDAA